MTLPLEKRLQKRIIILIEQLCNLYIIIGVKDNNGQTIGRVLYRKNPTW